MKKFKQKADKEAFKKVPFAKDESKRSGCEERRQIFRKKDPERMKNANIPKLSKESQPQLGPCMIAKINEAIVEKISED